MTVFDPIRRRCEPIPKRQPCREPVCGCDPAFQRPRPVDPCPPPKPVCCDPCPPQRVCCDPCPPPQPVCCDPCPPQRVCFDPCGPRCAEPRLIRCARLDRRCMSESLIVSGLPAGLCEPMALIGVEICGDVTVRMLHSACGPSPAVAEVTVPLTAFVRDARGCTYTGCTSLIVCCHLPCACQRTGGPLVAAARVRLIDGGCSIRATFDARLDVSIEVFAVESEPCGASCPRDWQSPQNFYPQPHYMRDGRGW